MAARVTRQKINKIGSDRKATLALGRASENGMVHAIGIPMHSMFRPSGFSEAAARRDEPTCDDFRRFAHLTRRYWLVVCTQEKYHRDVDWV